MNVDARRLMFTMAERIPTGAVWMVECCERGAVGNRSLPWKLTVLSFGVSVMAHLAVLSTLVKVEAQAATEDTPPCAPDAAAIIASHLAAVFVVVASAAFALASAGEVKQIPGSEAHVRLGVSTGTSNCFLTANA